MDLSRTPSPMPGVQLDRELLHDMSVVPSFSPSSSCSLKAALAPDPLPARLPASGSKRGRPLEDHIRLKNEAQMAKDHLKEQIKEIAKKMRRKNGEDCEKLREQKRKLQAEFEDQKKIYNRARKAINHWKHDRGMIQERQDMEVIAEELKQKTLSYYYELKLYVELAIKDQPAESGCCWLQNAFNWVSNATQEDRNSQPDKEKAWQYPKRARTYLSAEEINQISQENVRRFRAGERRRAETAEEKIKDYQKTINVINEMFRYLFYHVEEADYAVEADPLGELGAEEVAKALPEVIASSDQVLHAPERVDSMEEEEIVPDFEGKLGDEEVDVLVKERIEAAIDTLGDVLGLSKGEQSSVSRQGDFLEQYLRMQDGQGRAFDKMGVWKRMEQNCCCCAQSSPVCFSKKLVIDEFHHSSNDNPFNFSSILSTLMGHKEAIVCPCCQNQTLNVATFNIPVSGYTNVVFKIPSYLGDVAFPGTKEHILGKRMQPVFFLVAGIEAVTSWKRMDGRWLQYDNGCWTGGRVPKKLANILYIVFKRC